MLTVNLANCYYMDISHNSISPQICASKVLAIVPAVMRCIHNQVRQQKSTCLTIPQLRTLAFLQTKANASLSELAEYSGISSASTSTMIERLVQKEFVTRADDPKLRRKVVLNLTPMGEAHLQQVRQTTCDRLADKLGHLSTEQLTDLVSGLEELSEIFV